MVKKTVKRKFSHQYGYFSRNKEDAAVLRGARAIRCIPRVSGAIVARRPGAAACSPAGGTRDREGAGRGAHPLSIRPLAETVRRVELRGPVAHVDRVGALRLRARGFHRGRAAALGRFEAADGGTIFLDEIGNVPLEAQEKILRVVEYRTFERVGSVEAVEVDVRIVAATHADLPGMAAGGRFRPDLLDRLSFEVLRLPPLRERGGDIMLLARHFAFDMSRELGRADTPSSAASAVTALEAHPWPGNVRELKNVVERAVCRGEGAEVGEIVFDPFPQRPAARRPCRPSRAARAGRRCPRASWACPMPEAVRDLKDRMAAGRADPGPAQPAQGCSAARPQLRPVSRHLIAAIASASRTRPDYLHLGSGREIDQAVSPGCFLESAAYQWICEHLQKPHNAGSRP